MNKNISITAKKVVAYKIETEDWPIIVTANGNIVTVNPLGIAGMSPKNARLGGKYTYGC